MEVLESKSYRSYDYISRYTAFPYYYNKEDNKYIYGVTALLDLNAGYSLHIVKKHDSYDSIALDYYNTPTLYWVICDFNLIQDPYSKPKVGTRLKVPVLSSISFDLDRN